MLAEAEKDRIAEQISSIFEGLDLDDVAGVLTVQLAMLAAQGADSPNEAIEFLDEIRDEAAEILKSVQLEGKRLDG